MLCVRRNGWTVKLNSGSKRRPSVPHSTVTSRHQGKPVVRSRTGSMRDRRSISSINSRQLHTQGRRTSSLRASSSRRQPSTELVRLQSWRAKLQPMFLPSDLPIWLQSLIKIQQGVWFSAAALSALALGAYGWSVYSQQQWGRAYSQLQKLQRHERQLISGNELVKHQIAQQVDPKRLGLAPRKSNNVIFIQPDQNQTAPPPSAAIQPLNHSSRSVKQPLGY